MKILNVATKDIEGSIPLPDFDSVKAALRLFESGTTRSARETQRLGIGQVGGGMGAMLGLLAGQDRMGSAFVEQLIDQIDYHLLSSKYSFRKSYDYDGMGVFHKTTVEVSKTSDPSAPYLLHLYASYVGDAPEIGLAEALGIERGLYRSEVRIEIAQEKGRFEVDLGKLHQLLSRLSPKMPDAEMMAQTIVEGRSDYEHGPKTQPGQVILSQSKQGASVRLYIDYLSVDSFYDYKAGRSTWSCDGSVVRGPLRESYERRGKYSNPQVIIEVTWPDPNASTFERHPVTDPDKKKRMRQLSQKIEAAIKAG